MTHKKMIRKLERYLVIIELPAHHSEGVVLRVMVNVHLGEAGAGSRWNPALLSVVVNHH